MLGFNHSIIEDLEYFLEAHAILLCMVVFWVIYIELDIGTSTCGGCRTLKLKPALLNSLLRYYSRFFCV